MKGSEWLKQKLEELCLSLSWGGQAAEWHGQKEKAGQEFTLYTREDLFIRVADNLLQPAFLILHTPQLETLPN